MTQTQLKWHWADWLGLAVIAVIVAAAIGWSVSGLFHEAIRPAVEARAGDCGVRISTRGRAHTQSSPWYGMVADNAPCFDTMDDAEAAGFRGARR